MVRRISSHLELACRRATCTRDRTVQVDGLVVEEDADDENEGDAGNDSSGDDVDVEKAL